MKRIEKTNRPLLVVQPQCCKLQMFLRKQVGGEPRRVRGFALMMLILLLFVFLQPQLASSQTELPEKLRGVQAEEAVAASHLVSEMNIAEWLGPLAPVALSPFFAITLLSGMSLFGQEWISIDNPLLGEHSPLHNPTLFWVFLVLTVLTSLPRFSKVSKPLAQAADFLETWSAIIILVVLKAMTMTAVSGAEATPPVAQIAVPGFVAMAIGGPVAQAGALSVTWDILLMIAMMINVIVINTVKFFFEILIWITPVPFLDACFEVANKSVCAALMALYAWSPMAATVLNLLLFVVCCVMIRWIRRRTCFFRSILVDLVWGWFRPDRNKPKSAELVVFPCQPIGSIPTRAHCVLRKTDSDWMLSQFRWFLPPRQVEVQASGSVPQIQKGFLTCTLIFDGDRKFTFSRRHDDHLPELARLMGVECCEPAADLDDRTARKVELA